MSSNFEKLQKLFPHIEENGLIDILKDNDDNYERAHSSLMESARKKAKLTQVSVPGAKSRKRRRCEMSESDSAEEQESLRRSTGIRSQESEEDKSKD